MFRRIPRRALGRDQALRVSRAGRGRVADDRDSARGTRYEVQAATSSRFATAGSRRSVRTARLNSRPLEADGSVAAGQAPADGSVTLARIAALRAAGGTRGPLRRPREPGPRRHPSGHAGEFTNSLGSSIRWPSCALLDRAGCGGFSALARFLPRVRRTARRRSCFRDGSVTTRPNRSSSRGHPSYSAARGEHSPRRHPSGHTGRAHE